VVVDVASVKLAACGGPANDAVLLTSILGVVRCFPSDTHPKLPGSSHCWTTLRSLDTLPDSAEKWHDHYHIVAPELVTHDPLPAKSFWPC